MALDIGDIVQVSVNLSPNAAQTRNFGAFLVVGASNVIDVSQRMRQYANLTGVATDFGTAAPEYLAASAFFAQSPQPSLIIIGRWAQTATSGLLYGATLTATQQAIANFTGTTSGGFFFYLDGIPRSVVGLNFSSATNLNAVAGTVQTALAAIETGTTCTWSAANSRFTIVSGSTGVTSTVGYASAPTATGNIVFATNPAAASTITLNGTVVTFVSALTSGIQCLIGASLSATLQNLLTVLQASTDTQLVKFAYAVNATTLFLAAAASGTGGNALTLAASAATPSGSTLSGGSGTDVSTLLGLTLASGAQVPIAGIAAETALANATLMASLSNYWYGLSYAATLQDTDHEAIAAFIEGASPSRTYWVTTQEANTLSSTSTTDLAYVLSASAYSRTCIQYSSSSPYAVCSLFGRQATVNYGGQNTVITLMFKQEPTITAENLTETQGATLANKNCNAFVTYDNATMIVQHGVMSSGLFIDVRIGFDALANDIQTQVYNLLYQSPSKIPQTDPGMNQIANVIEACLVSYVVNGLLAPGTWTGPAFGSLNTGDYLPKGWYVYYPAVATQNPSQRSARASVPFTIAAKGAGAVHSAAVLINVNQ